MKRILLCLSCGLLSIIVSCAATPNKVSENTIDENSPQYRTLTNTSGLSIVRKPFPFNFNRGQITSIPTYNPSSGSSFQVDLRSYDLSSQDLSTRQDNLNYSVFDSQTIWPSILPSGFSPSGILEKGKNPGLGIRALHNQGITGKGIGVAIIDQPLLADHAEYADRLKCYEEIHWPTSDICANMHGPAVASFAVGKTVGVASEAELYYIAEMHGTYTSTSFDYDFTWLAQSIDRVLQINTQLPAANKIRVISISVGWSPDQKGYAEVTAAVNRAKQAGIFVVSSSLQETYGYRFQGLGRDPLSDPDNPASYFPGIWWSSNYYKNPDNYQNLLMVPMDSRTAASFTGNNDYFWGRSGGWSWSIPYIAGVYALACQVKPDVTPEIFWSAALSTGDTITINTNGKDYQFGKIINPTKLMNSLSK